MPPPPLPPLPAPPTVALSRGLPSTTTGFFVFDVAALATMAACLPTLRLFGRKRRWADLVSVVGRRASGWFGARGAGGNAKARTPESQGAARLRLSPGVPAPALVLPSSRRRRHARSKPPVAARGGRGFWGRRGGDFLQAACVAQECEKKIVWRADARRPGPGPGPAVYRVR